ncbi:beta-N-acetylglucosaminidase domain-containing protein [Streptomyces radiopugnans]|uniref:Hyaluronoglucosaminidase n=1 Tax=Streptomyces radiopugnans TaxID=403935 RepID=A0A1H8Z084_9ACTN|nr:beta-N-acetylglucosaminidase domain-containing protein [Streptomyces radiopugnans]SEP57929.1 hyaluronoglucosaminidase [Streptomyces radiopugnans]
MNHATHGRATRRTGATALVAAVLGGLLGGAPAAHSAPPQDRAAEEPAREAAGPDDRVRLEGAPGVWPRPQSLRTRGPSVPVGREVLLVADEDADPYALDTVRDVLRAAGAHEVRTVRPGEEAHTRGLVVRAGDRAAERALRALGAPERGDLPAGGYRLAAGRADGVDGPGGTVALAGVGPDGLFHAAQTLRQLVTTGEGGARITGAVVRDWPASPVRGTTEGFYGEAWPHHERLAHLDFMGRTKQNRYLYAPGDDAFRQSRWREPYPAERRAQFRELAERARRNHVVLGWAVSPGQSMCLASGEDRRALLRKIDAMAALGVRAFQLRFEDASYTEWHCDADAERYGTGPQAAATAHAELANEVAAHLARRYGFGRDAVPLSVLPTEFYQDGPTEYRNTLAKKLDADVEVAWTGVGVVPATITGGELAQARTVFRHPLVTMDNYPVNDYAGDRVFLGPYTGREPAVANRSAALLANAMEQATASRLPLFTVADYAWNPRGYRPEESWRAAVEDLAATGGGTEESGRSGQPGESAASGESGKRAREALHALAANNSSSVLDEKESAYLTPLLDAFWKARAGEDDEEFAAASDRLRGAFAVLHDSPENLAGVAGGALSEEMRPWVRQLARYGRAGRHALDMLAAQRRGDGAGAWKARLELQRLRAEARGSGVTVGEDVLPAFVDRALKAADDWSGARGGAEKAERSGERVRGGPAPLPGSPPENAADGDPATAFRAAEEPRPGAGDGEGDGSGDELVLRLPRARSLAAVTVQSEPGADTRAAVEAHVPGEGWRRLGMLSDRGWTEVETGGLRADAVRLAWQDGSKAPVIHELTPWYSDSPGAGLELSREEANAVIGGEPAAVGARLTGHRPTDVRGRLTVRAPEGFTVRAPRRVTLQRGVPATPEIEISAGKDVRPGTYRIPVTLTAEGESLRRTLTVRAYPPTGGPDLARGARTASSADETEDFPASAATDGDPETRWSSPSKDGQWLRVELDRPARIGEVRLHWQDAYASRYRVQVSADGRDWSTAATVRDGRGGRETVRMDAPAGTRYVRVVADERATRFGVSLWSVEAYAVLEPEGERD